jgi:hypothetical protein
VLIFKYDGGLDGRLEEKAGEQGGDFESRVVEK